MHYHTKAWGLWLLAALLPFLLTKNPFYVLLALAIVGLDYRVVSAASPTGPQWRLLLRLGVALALFGVLFNILFVSVGATRVLTLPALRLNFGATLIQIGGAVTLESLVYGLAQALGLLGILLVMATFNCAADHYDILRSTPRFLYQSAIALSIAVTFVPQMMVAQAEIREAQALRGHQFRALRDLPPLFIALLAEGLERSITLAESMSARGFASPPGNAPRRSGLLLQAIIALGLLALICGILALLYLSDKFIGGLILAVGGGMLLAVLWSIGQGVHRSRYRRGGWRRHDLVLAATSAVVIATWVGVWIVDRSALTFYPYPRLSWPPFQPLLAATILLLAVPAVALRTGKTQTYD